MSESPLCRPPRFPENEIMSLLDARPTHDFGESTSLDLTLGDLVADDDWAELKTMPIAYGTSRGGPELRRLLGRSLGVDADRVLVTQGAALALCIVAMEQCRGPEDEAVLVRPTFPPSLDAVAATGATIIEHTLRFADAYRLDPAAIEPLLTDRTRLVSLATPQNPSGVAIDPAAIAELAERLAGRCPGAYLVVDETYREAAPNGRVPPSAAGLAPNIIATGSISKAHGAPGLRIGWLTCHDDEMLARLARAKMNTVICTPALDEHLAAVVLRRAGDILTARARILAAALERLEAWHAEHADLVDWVRPDGGALCCFRLREAAFDDAAVAAFFNTQSQHDLRVASGPWFGDEPRVFRLGFGYLLGDRLTAALTALGGALRSVASRPAGV